ncbi:uncharacterized protein LOC127264845 [Andrographis paniculata]|uniref:uncharacterized protein LOC127264845 n=1 Tax=Andrographis paniculata TaxID=175694 RepID=UPI0021E812D8|nr:uncharacterized protein LOC127264845 [Andrographis paniculata]
MASFYRQILPMISSFLFFVVFFVSYANAELRIRNFMTGDEIAESDNIKALLSKMNKPAVKTIQSPDGDIVDCVLIHQQPAFDHPLLKGHNLLDPPKSLKRNMLSMTGKQDRHFQIWTKSNESCPEGSIPIRRTTEQDLLRASSIERFGRKLGRNSKATASDDHQHSIARVNGTFRGAKAFFNVWAPKVESTEEFSLAQMWISAGSFETDDLNTVEAGWQVYPMQYGDDRPRLFVYWTRDAYQNTGCYNLICSGFVQFSTKVLVGGSFAAASTYNGDQLEINLHVWKDADAWWLELGGETVGYWPAEIFTLLWTSPNTTVDFGGEIFTIRDPSSGHTTTEMGSGHFASEGFKKAALIRNMQIVDENGALTTPPTPVVIMDESNCYTIQVTPEGEYANWGAFLFHGGPGKNSACP